MAEIITAIPSLILAIAIGYIAVRAVSHSTLAQLNRDARREAELTELAHAKAAEAQAEKDSAKAAEAQAELMAECEQQSVYIAKLETMLAEARAEIRGLKQAMSGGINVSGGTVNVLRDLIGGSETKRNETNAGRDADISD